MKTIVPLLAIMLGLGFAARATVSVGRNTAALPALAAERDALEARIGQAEQQLRSTREACATASAASATNAPPLATPPARKPVADAVIANDPKMLAESLRNYRLGLDRNLVGIRQALVLNAGQVEELKDLMVQVEQRRLDLVAAVETQGLDQKSGAYQALNAENEAFRRAKEEEILGNLEPAYREYERTQAVRYPAAWLAAAALYTGETVTPAQVQQTAQILAANSERIQSGARRGWVQENTVNWSVATEQLQAVLTPSQIATLRASIEAGANLNKAWEEITRRSDFLKAQFKAQTARQ